MQTNDCVAFLEMRDGRLRCLLCRRVVSTVPFGIDKQQDVTVLRRYYYHRTSCNTLTRPAEAATVRAQLLGYVETLLNPGPVAP